MGAWYIVDQNDSMNFIESTLAFKCNRYSGVSIKSFKDRFCAIGNQQLEGIDLFETYAPVVQFITVLLMLTLEVLLCFKFKQVDVTAAFIHADITKDEKVYIEMSKVFEQFSNNGRKKCLKLK